MMKFYPLFLFLAIGFPLSSQTEIGGVINRYAVVTSIGECGEALEVAEVSGFSEGDEVMIYQAQGAVIEESNSASFGEILSLNSAGIYEVNRIVSIDGNTISFEFSLVHDYDLTGAVQVISVPLFADARVVDTLTAKVWDGTTGGVLALRVSGELTLEAPIDVSAKGFRGGLSGIGGENNCSFLNTVNDYAIGRGNWRGAMKGEGIAAYLPGKEAARGPQANGGGGGNDHNAGGGGGGHLVVGGNGGNNEEPRALGCKGRRPGLGGKAIDEISGRVYLGGGGGAGHDNNGLVSDGGQGGGIVLLTAGALIGNGFAVSANGAEPAVVEGDGAGGGGAGGTVLLEVTGRLVGSIQVTARGGNGGLQDNGDRDRCMGPGGGGAGGAIYTRLLSPTGFTADVDGGKAGLSINSSRCADGTNGAQGGERGVTSEWEGAILSSESNDIISIRGPASVALCEASEGVIEMEVTGNFPELRWQQDLGAGFADIDDGPLFSGTATPTLRILNPTSELEEVRFRLVTVAGDCGTVQASDPVTVQWTLLPVPEFTGAASGLTVTFASESIDADSLVWSFGDGEFAIGALPVHSYELAGTYTVLLQAFNECGTSTLEREFTVEDLPSRPIASFSFNNGVGCTPVEVAFINQSSSNAESFLWLLPGGQPASTAEPNPIVRYETPGTYSATLIALNELGSDTLMVTDIVTVEPLPDAAFDFLVEDLSVTFVSTSLEADEVEWDFGDGSGGAGPDEQHEFGEYGVFDVRLIAANSCGRDTVVRRVELFAALEAVVLVESSASCAPGFIRFSDQSVGNISARRWEFPGGDPAFSAEAAPLVRYDDIGSYDVRLVVENGAAADSTFIEDAVTILAAPNPVFTFLVDGLPSSFRTILPMQTSLPGTLEMERSAWMKTRSIPTGREVPILSLSMHRMIFVPAQSVK